MYIPPAPQPSLILANPLLLSSNHRLHNLAFSFDHFLYLLSSGDLEASDDELVSIGKNTEGIWERRVAS
jgi:hypothetical protein